MLALARTAAVYPQAGNDLYKGSGTTLDISNIDKGYFRVMQSETSKKVKMRVKLGDALLTYDLKADGTYEVFPLQLGEGKYSVVIYKQVSGNKYTQGFSKSFQVKLSDALSPYLCPNQMVWYTEESALVQKAQALCEGLEKDREKFDLIKDYVQKNVTYDFFLAMSIQSGAITTYLPDLDAVFASGKGICFDFAALMCAMLRSQGVPARLDIGYADKTYHAWVSAYIGDTWVDFDPTYASTGAKASTYTVERFY